MFIDEVKWIRSYRHKLCPTLRKRALECYRLSGKVPCYMQKPVRNIKKRLQKMPVIVQTYETRGNTDNIRKAAGLTGCAVRRELPAINAFSTTITAKQLEKLVQSNYIKKIWYDGEIRAVLDTAVSTVQSSSLWNRDITGKDVVIAVLDTGIYNHPDLEGRIVGFKDFIREKTEPYDNNGHGTHVAGDIAGSGKESGFRYRGPAPEAKLVGVKVLNKMGSGSLSVVIEGIQWCINNKDALGIRIINLSLGSDANESYIDDPVCQAAQKAWEAGIVMCVAAGNSGPEAKTINSPGIHPLVITVGALDDTGTSSSQDDKVADFSSRGPTVDSLEKPDILAPGVNIISLRSPKSMLDKQKKKSRVDEWYSSLSGTSMATPVCAGVIAQMLQMDSSLTPDQVKERLISTAKPLPGLDRNIQGAGVIDAVKAVDGARTAYNN